MTDTTSVPVITSGEGGEAAVGASIATPHEGLMAPEQNVQRIMHTGTVWFAAAIAAVALTMGPLLASGWRPAVLPPFLDAIWWLGSLGVAASLGLIGWSGCPILEVSVPVADRNKSRTMQLGTATLIISGVLCLFAVVAGPAV